MAAVVGLSGIGVGLASGQPTLRPGSLPSSAQPGTPVDPNVGDRDPRAVSLRRVEVGNAVHSFGGRLSVADFGRSWSPHNPNQPIATDPATGLAHSQSFQYQAPGLRALLDRPDYLVNLGNDQIGRNVQPIRETDQIMIMIIPANTVFQLTPETTPPPCH
ncbi:MAG: hypothetical protein AAGG38_04960 [Planctomycetota bacterium]